MKEGVKQRVKKTIANSLIIYADKVFSKIEPVDWNQIKSLAIKIHPVVLTKANEFPWCPLLKSPKKLRFLTDLISQKNPKNFLERLKECSLVPNIPVIELRKTCLNKLFECDFWSMYQAEIKYWRIWFY